MIHFVYFVFFVVQAFGMLELYEQRRRFLGGLGVPLRFDLNTFLNHEEHEAPRVESSFSESDLYSRGDAEARRKASATVRRR